MLCRHLSRGDCVPAFTDTAQSREWRLWGGLPLQAAVSRQACGGKEGGRAITVGTHKRQSIRRAQHCLT